MNVRFLNTVPVAVLPRPTIEDDRDLRLCCDPFKVYALDSGGEVWQNDYTGHYVASDDAAVFRITKSGSPTQTITLTTAHGTPITFPDADTTASGFVIDWQLIKNLFGTGTYTFFAEYNIAGNTGTLNRGTFMLRDYSTDIVKNSLRFDCVFNEYHQSDDVNFAGSGFRDSMRFGGRFWAQQLNTEKREWKRINRTNRDIITEDFNTYTLDSDHLSRCFTERLFTFLFKATEIFISDNSIFNHVNYKNIPVRIPEGETPEITYQELSTIASFSLTMGDRTDATVMRHTR